METQTRFDLNAAVQNWQQELAAQPDLTLDVRLELETHVRDTVAELQRRGLNAEESFWLARRRAGQPKQLGEEFAKADPAKVWRERLFWIGVALFTMELWTAFVGFLWYRHFTVNILRQQDRIYETLPAWISFYLPQWLTEIRTYAVLQVASVLTKYLPIICFAFLLLKRRLDLVSYGMEFLVKSRLRLTVYTFALLMVVEFFKFHMRVGSADWPDVVLVRLSLSIWPLSLIFFMAWLMPAKKSSALKSA